MSINKNSEKIKNMFDEISSYYDFMNNVISFGMHYVIKFLAIKELIILIVATKKCKREGMILMK